MSEQETKLDEPDFALGVPLEDLAEGGMILGHVAGEAVVLARACGALTGNAASVDDRQNNADDRKRDVQGLAH